MRCGWDHKFILGGGVRYGRFDWTLKFLFIYLFIYIFSHSQNLIQKLLIK